ncbi:acyltransferase [Geopsychrobacter electrodiphilus]|uniref:acyltransferase n=1 Tax=Geopsychrobacter electrodiphilus TaxID=225196 RepID=UPI000368152F|nr:acyltransferase [Geopsychrobacter electrodiphilus]
MIHNTAIISNKASIGNNVTIGAYTSINDYVEIGDNTVIENYCEIGYATPLAENKKLVIGANSHIRSHSVFYQGSIFGDNLVTGHRVTIREKIKAGSNLQIGTLCDFQGDCVIGDFVRTHSNVHIGKESKIGNYVFIFPYVVLTNDPHPPSDTLLGVTIEDYAVIATMSVILPGVIIHEHALVGAHSLVKSDVPPKMVVAGNPAKVICETAKIKLSNLNESAYPWPKHFHRGYPESIIAQWEKEFGC